MRELWRRGEETILSIQVTNLDSHSMNNIKDDDILTQLERKKKGKY